MIEKRATSLIRKNLKTKKPFTKFYVDTIGITPKRLQKFILLYHYDLMKNWLPRKK